MRVTPLVGVWIEICVVLNVENCEDNVTPLVGVWIEIPLFFISGRLATCHSPCGSVD